MNEQSPTSNPEDNEKLREEKEQQERYEYYMQNNPPLPIETPPMNNKESTSEIPKYFKEMIESFEAQFPLEELNEIIELSTELENAIVYEGKTSEEEVEKACKYFTIPGYADIYRAKIAAIRDNPLSPEDQRKCDLRTGGRKALIPIHDTLKSYRDGNPELYELIKAEYKRLSNAVGMINNGKVDHNR